MDICYKEHCSMNLRSMYVMSCIAFMIHYYFFEIYLCKVMGGPDNTTKEKTESGEVAQISQLKCMLYNPYH